MTLDPREAQRLIDDERNIEVRKLRFAAELDSAKEEHFLRRTIRNQMAAVTNPGSKVPPTIQALSAHERKTYSISKLVADMVKETKETTLEREVSWSLQKDVGTPEHGGHLIPLRLSMSGLDTRTNAQGGFLTSPKVNDIIDYLINQSKVLSLGAKFMTGLRYSQQFPTEDSPLQTSWVSENPQVDVSQSDVSFGYRSASPHALQSTTSASRQLLQQASPSMEAWLKSRIARGHALAIDAAAINGSGVENEPLGLLSVQGVADVPIGSNGGTVTAAHILSLEDAIGTANADSVNCAFLTTTAQRKKLRTIPEMTGGGEPIWKNGRMLGYVAEVSNNVPSTLTKGSAIGTCSAIVFADWSQLLVAEFSGAVEVLVDPYAGIKKGMVELSSWALYDVLLLEPAAFAAIQDAT